MSAWTNFRNKITGEVKAAISPVKTSTSIPAPGGSLFDAIYQFGKGKVDAATKRVATAFRESSAGARIEAEVTRQKIQELLPFIILGVIVLIAGTLYFAKRR